MKPHKWHKEIKAWADGAEIERRRYGDKDSLSYDELVNDIKENWNKND
jgi:hypothetical protein